MAKRRSTSTCAWPAPTSRMSVEIGLWARIAACYGMGDWQQDRWGLTDATYPADRRGRGLTVVARIGAGAIGAAHRHGRGHRRDGPDPVAHLRRAHHVRRPVRQAGGHQPEA